MDAPSRRLHSAFSMATPPAQVLFDRVIRTWIGPAAQERAKDPAVGPLPLHLAAVIWREGTTKPEVFLNSEMHEHVRTMKIAASGPFPAGTRLAAEHVAGVHSVVLRKARQSTPFIFIIQGAAGKYFLLSRHIERVLKHREFDVLSEPLALEGVRLAERTLSVFFDFVRNLYDGLPRGRKGAETKQAAKLKIEAVARTATERVRRHMQLPVVIVHQDEGEFVKLLIEARETYIDGHFFSAIASAVTTANLVCIRLAERYPLNRSFRRKLLGMTFGQKDSTASGEGIIHGNA